MGQIEQNRDFMKARFGSPERKKSDQQKGVPYPPLQKEVKSGDGEVLPLPQFDPDVLVEDRFRRLLERRQSRRKYNQQPLSRDELSFLLYCTQGVKEQVGEGYATRRTVPSAGARHPFETYLAVNRIEGLEPGIYRYLPLEHRMVFLGEVEDLSRRLTAANLGQGFVGQAACVFIWTCVPYRAEWRYGTHAHKNMLLDAGHICQNLYLGVESLGAGTCAIGAYDQEMMDELVSVDGKEEYVVYLAPVGKH